jgi:hypothetical protein
VLLDIPNPEQKEFVKPQNEKVETKKKRNEREKLRTNMTCYIYYTETDRKLQGSEVSFNVCSSFW